MKTLITVTLIVLASYAAQSSAQNDAGAQVGVLYGLSVPDAQNSNPRSLYGVKGTANLSPSLSLGGYYLVNSAEEGSGGRKFEYSLHGIEGAFRIPKGAGATFVGLRAGLSKVRSESTTGDKYILSPYHYGLVTGHDFSLTKWLSIGFEGSYIVFEGSKTTENGTLYEEEPFNAISFLVSLQFRL